MHMDAPSDSDRQIPSGLGTPPPHLVADGLVNPSNVGDVLLALRRSEAEARRGLNSTPISTWAVTVIFACLALGFLGSAIRSLSRELGHEQNQANVSKTAAQFAEGLNEDMGKLLADPHTQLVRLSSGALLSADAAIAWNGRTHDGALFCDKLPMLDSPRAYEIWAIAGTDQGAKLGEVAPAPGVSVYPFHYSDALDHLSRFEVTAGSRGAGKLPVLTGAVQ
jgi:hypothetical protein